MIGESLEQHCETEFNKLRATAFKNAYFEKDNDIKTGSKGDFIYREYSNDGVEFIWIMFEMKNEMAKPLNEINYSIWIQEPPWGTFLTEGAPRFFFFIYINIEFIKQV